MALELLQNTSFEGVLAPWIPVTTGTGTVTQTTGTAGTTNAHTGTSFVALRGPAETDTASVTQTVILPLPPGAVLRLSFAGRIPAVTAIGDTTIAANAIANGVLPVATINIPLAANPTATLGEYEYSPPSPSVFSVLR